MIQIDRMERGCEMNSQASSQEMIRQMNRKLVLEAVRKNEPVSRAWIAKELQLSRSTVSQIADSLIQSGMIFEAEMEETSGKSGGRPGQMLRYNAVSSYLIGADLTGEKSILCVADLRGRILRKEEFPPVADAEDVHGDIRILLEAAKIPAEKIGRISISLPGSVNADGKVIRCTRLHWRNYDLKKELTAWYPKPIDINNDVNLALIGEQRFGNGQKCGNLVYLHLGEGIGCAILCNGRLVAGHSFMAGEIGATVLRQPQEDSSLTLEETIGLSRFGSMEAFLSAVAGYTRGRERDVENIQGFIRILTTAIVFTVGLLNPHRLILGGVMSEAMPDILEDIREAVASGSATPVDIQLASLGGEACLTGALAFALNQLDRME